jgi:hypothetical protein
MMFLSVSNLMFKCMSEILQCFICITIIDDDHKITMMILRLLVMSHDFSSYWADSFHLHGNLFYVVNDAQWVIPQICTMVKDIDYEYYHCYRHHQTTWINIPIVHSHCRQIIPPE